jgi:HTH-type transcriptional regulator, sugar sensing transcriptional regulator
MIIKDNFLGKLREAFNLNIYEVKIWTALLSRGISTAGELSDISEVPRSRSYDVLESLEKKGFVMMKLGKPIKYIAVEPAEVVKRVKKQVRDNTEGRIEKLEEVKKTEIFTELKLLFTQGIKLVEPSDLSGSIKGRENVYNEINAMLSDAEKSVVIVTSSEGLSRKANSLKKSLRRLKEKNVNVRVVAPINKDNLEAAKELLGVAQVRNTKRIDARFVIKDGKDLLFMVMSDKEVHPSYDVGIWVRTPFFAQAMEGLFNVIWDKLEDGRVAVGNLSK